MPCACAPGSLPVAFKYGTGSDGGPASIVAAFCRPRPRGRTRRCWPRCTRRCCRRSNAHGPIEAWIIDDTGFPKKGKHSVGVARQYCGQLGKQDNCQVAVSLSIANRQASLPVRYRLYLPQEWARMTRARKTPGVPEEIVFETKPEIALEQLRWACEAGLPRGVVLLDAGYGNRHPPAYAITCPWAELCCRHSVEHLGVGARHQAVAAQAMVGRGRPPDAAAPRASTSLSRSSNSRFGLPLRAWRTITWREGTAEPLSLALRARARARRPSRYNAPAPELRNGADRMA